MSGRFHFSLRALLVATMLIAGPLAWLAHNLMIVRERKAIMTHIEREDWAFIKFLGAAPGSAKKPGWPRGYLGDRPLYWVGYDSDKDPDGAQLSTVRRVFPEANIYLMTTVDGRVLCTQL